MLSQSHFSRAPSVHFFPNCSASRRDQAVLWKVSKKTQTCIGQTRILNNCAQLHNYRNLSPGHHSWPMASVMRMLLGEILLSGHPSFLQIQWPCFCLVYLLFIQNFQPRCNLFFTCILLLLVLLFQMGYGCL